jgi:hypothetical protein
MVEFALRDYRHSFQLDHICFMTAIAGAASGFYATTDHSQGDFARNSIFRCAFVGKGEGATGPYWTDAIKIENVCGTSIDSCVVTGNSFGGSCYGHAVNVYGTGSGQTSIFTDISKCHFIKVDVGVYYGNEAQGITVTQTNIQPCNYGIYAYNGVNELQLNVTDCQIDPILGGIIWTAGDNNSVSPHFGQGMLSIKGNVFVMGQPGISAIDIGMGKSAAIIGNLVFNTLNPVTYPTAAAGGIIGVAFAGTEAMITGNVFRGLAYGVYCNTGASASNVQSNTYPNCANTVGGPAVGSVTHGGGSE